MEGASLAPPAIDPTKYAPMSVAHTQARIQMIVSRPWAG
jgi:hypothetical protein